MTLAKWAAGKTGAVVGTGVGLALVAVAAYAILGVAAHTLSARDYTAVASLYLLINIAGTGVFTAVEQETNREVSDRRALGIGVGNAVRAGALLSGLLAVAVLVTLLVASPLIVDRVFAGSPVLLGAMAVAVTGAAAVSVVRGALAGSGRYGWYAVTVASEGLGRLAALGLFVAVSRAWTAGPGIAFAIGTLVAAAGGLPGARFGPAGPRVARRAMGGSIGYLVGASSLMFFVANVAPVVLTARLPADPATAATFASIFVLARIPLFLFAPAQAFLLPSLTAAASGGNADLLRARLRTLGLVVAGVAVPGVVLGAFVGPWLARTLLATPAEPTSSQFVLLGVSTAMMIVAQVLQPALVALGRHRVALAAWTAGTVVFVAILLGPWPPLGAALSAQLVGPAVVGAVMVVDVGLACRRMASETRRPPPARTTAGQRAED